MGHIFLLLLALLFTCKDASFHAEASFTEDKSIAGIRGMIGSRPPSCAGRCRSCGHCEAVQVPITPRELQTKKRGEGDEKTTKLGSRASSFHTATAGRKMPSSYEDHSNYKPLSWRCKCGGLILNP